MKKIIITSFIAGIILTAFSYHAYIVYQLRASLIQHSAVIQQHDAVLKQIVELINANNKPK